MRLARALAFGASLCLMMLAGRGIATAQGEYQWSVYSALNSVQGVAFDSSGTLWAATTGGVVGAAADTFPIYRTTEGLLSLNVTAIAFDPLTRQMYVGGADGNINIRRGDGSWSYATEIASKTELPSRQINGFGFREGRVYVLTDFGVGVYDPVAGNFIESYFNLGPVRQNSPVYAIAFELYENGISRALTLNYSDFSISGEMTSLELKKEKPCP